MSFLRQSYYHLKPYLPHGLRIAARRHFAARILQRSCATWPINPDAGSAPANWPGWPEGKQFAFVLTHDVEGPRGLDRCLKVAELESNLGFRSSFNFIPEGPYETPPELRRNLSDNGFEIGVHDLKHDGKLYRSRDEFRRHATKINNYLREWGATGFRSGFMHHKLDWLHDLDIAYDMSTFDTDPFEPQPDGANTIFPFWVPRPQDHSPLTTHHSPLGYLELPYTLPQDSTLFLILREHHIDTWKAKLDWIARHGGMALLNTHPDYMRFEKSDNSGHNYNSRYYHEFLAYVCDTYSGKYWGCQPRQISSYLRQHRSVLTSSARPGSFSQQTKKIWIDLDNTPHVPFFKPIITELEKRGHSVAVTSRRAFQVSELAEKMGVRHTPVGRHYGKNPVAKVLGLFIRAFEFLPFLVRERPALAVSHGARSQILICNFLRIPTVLLADYEHASILPFLRPTWLYVPEVIPLDGLKKSAKHVRHYPGIKEDVYVPGFRPSGHLLAELNLDPAKIIVTVRPPANEAHYRSPESDALFEATMIRLTQRNDTQIVLLPRNGNQLNSIRQSHSEWFKNGQTIVPGPVDGLELIWNSDLVISGGGTMNREAAALDIPVYSIFRGKTGAVDKHLSNTGRLIMVEQPEQVGTKVFLKKRSHDSNLCSCNSKALSFIVNAICKHAGSH